MSIQRHELPILEYDPVSEEVLAPNHDRHEVVLPEKCVFAFLGELIDRYAAQVQAEIAIEFETITKKFPVYILHNFPEPLCLVQAPLGASAAAMLMDFLIAYGCRKFISAGSCGVLSDIPENQLLVPVRALRDEGTSYQYLPPARYQPLDSRALEVIKRVLREHNCPYLECVTWTTDGFYRETRDMVAYRRAEGCAVVEMECAALAACAQKRGAMFGQFLYTADSLANVHAYDARGWGNDSLEKALQLCLDIALAM